jgi:hypothetical protein
LVNPILDDYQNPLKSKLDDFAEAGEVGPAVPAEAQWGGDGSDDGRGGGSWLGSLIRGFGMGGGFSGVGGNSSGGGGGALPVGS